MWLGLLFWTFDCCFGCAVGGYCHLIVLVCLWLVCLRWLLIICAWLAYCVVLGLDCLFVFVLCFDCGY